MSSFSKKVVSVCDYQRRNGKQKIASSTSYTKQDQDGFVQRKAGYHVLKRRKSSSHNDDDDDVRETSTRKKSKTSNKKKSAPPNNGKQTIENGVIKYVGRVDDDDNGTTFSKTYESQVGALPNEEITRLWIGKRKLMINGVETYIPMYKQEMNPT